MAVSRDTVEAVLNACRKLIAFIDSPPADTRERLVGLDMVFDELALATNRLGASEADGGLDFGPECEYERIRKRITPLFPGAGCYWVALDLEKMEFGQENFGLGDLLDDLSDIYKDALEAVMYAKQAGDEDGAKAFAWSFEYHTREHIRNAQVYISHLLEGL